MGYIGFPRHEFSQWPGYVNKNDFNHMRGFKKWGSPKNGEFDHEKNDLTIKNRDLTMKKTEWTNKNRGFWCNPRFSRTKGPHFWVDRALFFWENTGMPEANYISTLQRKAKDLQSRGNFQSHLLSSSPTHPCFFFFQWDSCGPGILRLLVSYCLSTYKVRFPSNVNVGWVSAH